MKIKIKYTNREVEYNNVTRLSILDFANKVIEFVVKESQFSTSTHSISTHSITEIILSDFSKVD